MEKFITSNQDLNQTDALLDDNSTQSTSTPPYMFTDDEIKQATTRMEELWAKLATLWPAVKKNP